MEISSKVQPLEQKFAFFIRSIFNYFRNFFANIHCCLRMKYTEITEAYEKKAIDIIMGPCVESVNNKKTAFIKKNKDSNKIPKPANTFIW
jgi:hypothetical protein